MLSLRQSRSRATFLRVFGPKEAMLTLLVIQWMDDSNYSEPKHITEAQAAFAGNGHGLCTSYQDFLKCSNERRTNSRHVGLFTSLTSHALYLSLDKLQKAFPRWLPDGPRVLDFSLGLDGRNNFASDNEYWASMRTRIVGFVTQYGQQPAASRLSSTWGRECNERSFY
jgi:hypothetical protein